MRNGMNIAGVSEVVHEVQAEPHEAVFRYAATAEWRPGRGIHARNEPAVLGTVKSPRRFELAVAEENGPTRGDGPTPVRLALTALGACALTTFVGGGSARGVTLESLRLVVDAEQVRDDTSNRLTDVAYTLAVRADTGGVDLAEVMAGVEAQSPNHRTLVDPQPLTLVLDGTPEPAPEPPAPATVPGTPVSTTVTWSYSVQLVATTDGDPTELRVDQPKQVAGVDWGPNPQEYLLMALASCVLEQLVELSARRGRPRHPWRVGATGQVDIRGLFDIGDDPMVPVHRLTLSVTPLDSAAAGATDAARAAEDWAVEDGAVEGWQDLVREAVRRSPVVGLLTAGHVVKTEFDTGTEAAHG